MPGLTPPNGTNAPALPSLSAPPPAAPAAPTPESGPGGLPQDVNMDGVVDEQDVMLLEDFVKMLKSVIRKKSTPADQEAGPQDVLSSPSAVKSAELMDPKFESATPSFLGQ